MSTEPIIEMCDFGHKFGKLPDHPHNSDGFARCPHCMSIGLDDCRQKTNNLEDIIANVIMGFITNDQEDSRKALLDLIKYCDTSSYMFIRHPSISVKIEEYLKNKTNQGDTNG